MAISHILNRTWKGEISLAQAYWGIGLLGLFPLVALIAGFSGSFVLSMALSNIQVFPTSIRLALAAGWSTGNVVFSVAFLSLGVFVFQTVVIWRSAKQSPSKLWRKSAQGAVVSSWLAMLIAPPALVVAFLVWAFTPESYVDTDGLKDGAPEFFHELTGMEYPEGVTVAQVSWFRIVEEFSHHLVLDATHIDLNKWIETARPFGKPLQRGIPKKSLELNAYALTCGSHDTRVDPADKPNHRLVNIACKLMSSPREVWIVQNRHRSDWMRTLIVDEKARMIWLHETEW